MLEDLYRLLRAGHVQAQGIVDTMTQPIVVVDQAMIVSAANNSFIKTFRVDRDEVVGHSLFDVGNGQWDIGDLRRLMSDVIPKAAAIIGFEVQHDFPEIGQKTFLVDARKLVHPDDNSTSILVLFDDVTERKRADAEKDFLISETRHRMKNLFAVVRSLAMRIEVEGQTASDYRDIFLEQLEATLRAQQIASSSEPTDLAFLLHESVSETEVDRVKVDGDAVTIDSSRVVTLSMMFHELATNSLKYGALSVQEGHVAVHWRVENGSQEPAHIVLTWTDHGGPPVQPPSKTGYGTQLLEGASRHMGGAVELDYRPDGLVVTLRLPL
ncbi:Two-component sensor histidine kinase, contains HisKA and HATPase domains [Xaviernesmea oryzae]|nr:Two-component sensor histidine kinase, contains HisKA and HATPase domains [Xaviernesmea oryzae]